ncbi:MAG TPA: DoxX family protein [Anaerolineales bacterium]|nr:DoxX family protein [Anaerolineales bacterium]
MLTIELGIFILRLVIGLLFIGHGSQKLFGWFGGKGLQATARGYESLRLRPAKLWAVLAGLSEFLGGVGLALGFLTPLAAALIIGVMLMAIIKVHLPKGIWNQSGGFEYPLVNALIAAFIGLFGPGVYALDKFLKMSYPTNLVFVISLALVVVGVLIGMISDRLITQSQTHTA